MVHNGIEYALLQAYAEGFHLLKDGAYNNLDVASIAHLWQHGAIIDSFILEMVGDVLERDQEFAQVSGKVAESGMGRWTVQEAREQNIPVTLLEDALEIRKQSQETGGNYATKLVALLRNQFGGHPVGQLPEKLEKKQ
jgi:6-phosphogluconate dehydrogenase